MAHSVRLGGSLEWTDVRLFKIFISFFDSCGFSIADFTFFVGCEHGFNVKDDHGVIHVGIEVALFVFVVHGFPFFDNFGDDIGLSDGFGLVFKFPVPES